MERHERLDLSLRLLTSGTARGLEDLLIIANILMRAGTLGCQVSVVHGGVYSLLVHGPKHDSDSRLTKGHRGGSAHVLVHMLIHHGLKHIGLHILLIHDNRVMGRASSTLNGRVRIEVEIVTERLGDIAVHQCTWNRIPVLVRCKTAVREDAHVMTLLSDNDSEVDLGLVNLDMDSIMGLLELTL